MQRPCERYNLEKYLLNTLPELEAFFEEHRTIFEYVSTHSGEEMTKDDICQSIEDLNSIYSSLSIEVNFHIIN